MNQFRYFDDHLEQRTKDGLLRKRVIAEHATARTIMIDKKEYVNFASNDYLGLSGCLDDLKMSDLGLSRIGSGSSPLVTGFTREHDELEHFMCDLLGYEAALLCNSGFAANSGLLQALFNEKGVAASSCVFQDKLNHASLIDGSLSSAAKLERFNHNDFNHLRQRLEKSKAENKLIVSEGVFSMDGDCCDVRSLNILAKQYRAWTLIDDAHAFGVIGQHGLGSIEFAKPDLLVITFGKAVGGQGACVLAKKNVIEYLVQFNREYIYSTAMSPLMAAINLVQIKRCVASHGSRSRLRLNIALFRELALLARLPLMESKTPIQPIVLGDAEATTTVQMKLKQKGIWLSAIRPPTVPFNTARLRVTLTAMHTEKDIKELVNALGEVI
ncbi:8-amino-7-oxononanoate synthase [Pseudoalteromonas luteoviolacea B = ATCC 29581]|nr:8-amino-7-oxononanoate synthase [Pseudoalteromonas luteoviolacea B = ATCC 29581]